MYKPTRADYRGTFRESQRFYGVKNIFYSFRLLKKYGDKKHWIPLKVPSIFRLTLMSKQDRITRTGYDIPEFLFPVDRAISPANRDGLIGPENRKLHCHRSQGEGEHAMTPIKYLTRRVCLAPRELAIAAHAETLDSSFCDALSLLLDCSGNVIIRMGKAGLIGRKMAATFASTGTRPLFTPPRQSMVI